MNNTLRHVKKKTSVVLPHDDPQQLALLFINFLKQYGNFYSETEIEKSKAMEIITINETQSQSEDSWRKISKTKHKRVLYFKLYINERYGNLSKQIRDQLYTYINIYYESGAIKLTDVEYDNGQILDIRGIGANEKGIFLTRDIRIPQNKVVTKMGGKPKQYYYMEKWRKYNENFQKSFGNPQLTPSTESKAEDSDESDEEN